VEQSRGGAGPARRYRHPLGSDDARQIDYWVTAGSTPAAILASYADATGHSPVMPGWATGFWQSKLRYRSQEELLGVAREYHRRGLPLAVIVADFFHWTALGEWKFDEASGQTRSRWSMKLASMGTRLMVSVWPSVTPSAATGRAQGARPASLAPSSAWKPTPLDGQSPLIPRSGGVL